MEVSKNTRDLQSDVILIQKIPIITTILDVICRTTGMGFAAVARVTDDHWITCSVNDKIGFGLKPGDELRLETTICNEIRQSGKAVIIDHVAENPLFCTHHTPAMYGFQSYISVPVIRKDGSFFGTLCAIDPEPAKLSSPEIIGMFNLFSDLISFHLNAIEELESSESALLREREERTKTLEKKNAELQKVNSELESFAYMASHDLQEPLRKIETFTSFILHKDYNSLSKEGKHYFDRLNKSVKRMQTLIRDLIMYTKVKVGEQVFSDTSLKDLVEEIRQAYNEDNREVVFEVPEMCNAFVIPFQFNQLLQNLIGNSIKFSKPGVNPVVRISGAIEKGNRFIQNLYPESDYCHITVSDNGIGFDQQYSERMFKVFQRLNRKEDYEGTGIGLSIVKKIVDNHNGVITACGELNKGARFDIYIPQPSLSLASHSNVSTGTNNYM